MHSTHDLITLNVCLRKIKKCTLFSGLASCERRHVTWLPRVQPAHCPVQVRGRSRCKGVSLWQNSAHLVRHRLQSETMGAALLVRLTDWLTESDWDWLIDWLNKLNVWLTVGSVDVDSYVGIWKEGLFYLIHSTLSAPYPLMCQRWLRKQFYAINADYNATRLEIITTTFKAVMLINCCQVIRLVSKIATVLCNFHKVFVCFFVVVAVKRCTWRSGERGIANINKHDKWIKIAIMQRNVSALNRSTWSRSSTPVCSTKSHLSICRPSHRFLLTLEFIFELNYL